jgi:hypothetical protein
MIIIIIIIIIIFIITSEADTSCEKVFQSGPLLVFDSSLGFGIDGVPKNIESKSCYFSKYYANNKRDLSQTNNLTTRVKEYLEKFVLARVNATENFAC